MTLKPAVYPSDHILGNSDADLTIVEFGDYQCPHCVAAHPILKEMLHTFGSQIKFVFRNFPMQEIHPFARAAALAAEAAALQGKFWEMHDALLEHPSHLDQRLLLKMAADMALDTDQFASDMSLEKLAAKVDDDFESGMRSGVNGTPNFFINGEKFHGGAMDLLSMIRENTQ